MPQAERVAVAAAQDRLCSHLPLKSDARKEKKTYKQQTRGCVLGLKLAV